MRSKVLPLSAVIFLIAVIIRRFFYLPTRKKGKVMSSPLYNIASSGLKAAQIALAMTSNNISNAYVDGYNLQRVTLSEAQQSGALGNGV